MTDASTWDPFSLSYATHSPIMFFLGGLVNEVTLVLETTSQLAGKQDHEDRLSHVYLSPDQ
jgi:hypothetical protein